MNDSSSRRNVFLLLTCFLVSRILIKICGVQFGYHALFEYWQYLDVNSLQTNLLQSVWYQHSQPPVFNLLLGTLLKISGNNSRQLIEYFLMAVSCSNALLLLFIIKRLTDKNNLALLIALLYLLSPATLLFENELFYTTFISLLLLLAVHFFLRFRHNQSWQNLTGMFAALTLLCLTRSMYHLLWLITISATFAFLWRAKNGVRKILPAAMISIVITGGWYLKNKILFDHFSASSWVGMNFARIVFHENNETDKNSIASIPPFLPASYYDHFVSADYALRFAGLNDPVLLAQMKNGPYINMNNVVYLPVSDKYLDAGLREISDHPAVYLKNVAKAFLIFFTPASSYYKLKLNNRQISYYDLVFSLNFSHLFKDEYAAKQSLAIVAIARLILYLAVIFIFIRQGIRTKAASFLNTFIIVTIFFSLIVGSLLEYGENMRFRFELEPLFLVLCAQALVLLQAQKNRAKA